MKNKIHGIWRESLADKTELWRQGLHGFERETFRLDGLSGVPAATSHEQIFAQPLQSGQIARWRGSEAEKVRLRELLPHALTLDFSDQQIELVSVPHGDIASAEADIALLLRFVSEELQRQGQGEILWAFSQPPLFTPKDMSAIRVADFGDDPDAAYKEAYREQLVLRYGKAKQSWTGVHYNYSLDLRLFEDVDTCACETYVHMGRNLWRNYWLIQLLFGCTPSVSDFYAQEVWQHSAKGGGGLAAPPRGATSLHSHFGYGYRSPEQQLQYLDYSDPYAYWQSVERMAKTESRFFRRLSQHAPLNSDRLIQDSRELYAPFRLKQLHAHGNECWDKHSCLVDYLELRILDIDPLFNREYYSGIYLPSAYFAHLLLLHSTLLDSPPLLFAELLRCARREQYIISQGLRLPPAHDLYEQATVLLDELGELASILGLPQVYSQVVRQAQKDLGQRHFRGHIYHEQFTPEPAVLLRHSRSWTKFLQSLQK